MDRSRWRNRIGMIVDHDECEWVNVSSGTGSPGLPRTKSRAIKRLCVCVCVGLRVHRYRDIVGSVVCSHFGPGHFGPVLGHFSPWAVCRILDGGCSGVSRVSRVKVRVRDGCHDGWRHALPKLLWGGLVTYMCVAFLAFLKLSS